MGLFDVDTNLEQVHFQGVMDFVQEKTGRVLSNAKQGQFPIICDTFQQYSQTEARIGSENTRQPIPSWFRFDICYDMWIGTIKSEDLGILPESARLFEVRVMGDTLKNVKFSAQIIRIATGAKDWDNVVFNSSRPVVRYTFDPTGPYDINLQETSISLDLLERCSFTTSKNPHPVKIVVDVEDTLLGIQLDQAWRFINGLEVADKQYCIDCIEQFKRMNPAKFLPAGSQLWFTIDKDSALGIENTVRGSELIGWGGIFTMFKD